MIVDVSKLHGRAIAIDEMIAKEVVERGVTRDVARRSFLLELGLAPVIRSGKRWVCGTLVRPSYQAELREAANEILCRYRRPKTHDKKAMTHVIGVLNDLPVLWAQNKEVLEMALLAVAFDRDVELTMDPETAKLWYSRLPNLHVPMPLVRHFLGVMTRVFADHSSWVELNEAAERLMRRGVASKYDHAIGMALSGIDDLFDY